MPVVSTLEMDHRRSFQVAALSPVQCAAYRPVPGKLDLQALEPSAFSGPFECILVSHADVQD